MTVPTAVGSLGGPFKENRGLQAVKPALENRPTKTEPDSSVMDDGNERIPLCDSRPAGRRLWPAPVTQLDPIRAAGPVAEVTHRMTKAAYSPRIRRHTSRRNEHIVEEQAETIQALNARIRALEKSERRLKSRLLGAKESLKDSNADLQAAQYQASILEERLDNEIVTRRDVEVVLERYRSWWLNEYYCLRVALQMIGDPDDGVAAMAESSRARYLLYLASQSDSI